MAGLFVYRSNHLEELGRRLAEVVRQPLSQVLQAETIVVQSLGMRRWVSFELAAQLGVTMNCRFPFFQEFAHELLRPATGGSNAFARTALPWRIFSLLPQLVAEAGYEPLHRYAGDGALAAQKQYQLAQQIGSVFDRYLAYAPERLLRWEAGEDAHWQARLWRVLVAGGAPTHPPALLQNYLRHAPVPAADAPTRVSIFGLSSVPPFYLHLLAAAARQMAVHLFLLVPTDQYWGDFLSAKEQRRLLRRAGHTAAELHLETGNELLLSLGKAGKAFIREVAELQPHDEPDCCVPPRPDTLLRALQRDIFQVGEPMAPADDDTAPAPESIATDDLSLQIHCCHGPMRELQALHDRLLELFEQLPGLLPKDILVTMPEVEAYAPFIEAVFDAPGQEAQRLPFSIADRSARAESSVARALLQLLELHGGRFGASAVLALLETKPIRDRFGIAESELDLLRDWVDAAGICWGIDGAHRATTGTPPFEHNSWRAGLERLLLGYALPGNGETLYGEVLPYPEIEGSLALLLGRFVDFAEKLFHYIPALSSPRPLAAWEEALRGLLEIFVEDSDALGDELKRVRQALRQLGALVAFHAGPVPFEVLRTHLAAVLAETDGGFGFLAGPITFCSLKPMRSVPFRVVCILGLEGSAFPRREPQLGFDLLAQEGRGRSRRDDDRQLFLENILSARDALVLSYSGLSARDNSEAPPSIVISELLDYVARNYRRGDQAGLEIIRHPLQPFSPRYFDGKESALFSYAQAACADSRASQAPRAEPALAPLTLLAEVAEPNRLVDLAELAAFFTNPAKYFLQRCLRVRWPEREEEQDDCEPLALDTLTRWKLQDRLARGATLAPEEALLLTRAEGVLPAGWFGRSCFESMRGEVEVLRAAAEAVRGGDPQPPQPVTLALGDWRLSGMVADQFPAGQVRLVPWKMKGKNRLQAWIYHLARCAAGHAQPTWLFALDRSTEFQPTTRAPGLLHELLEIFAQGQREPLPFFPETSFLAARAPTRGQDDRGARGHWEKEEGRDAYHERCFRGVEEPLGPAWAALATQVYGPMLEQMREAKYA